MTIQHTYQVFQSKKKLNLMITVCIVLFICANIMLDFVLTLFQNSSFYISESLLFSSYWLLFIPLLMLVLKISMKTIKTEMKLSIICFVIIFHLFSYPALVWAISKIFYNHTFEYWQTFSFGLSAYFIKTMIIYGFSFIAITLFNKKKQIPQIRINDKKNFITSILISDKNNVKFVLQVNEILCFSANSPYININHHSKKYLFTETLKSLESQLDDKQFIRIHKSHIVNIHKISSIQSRQNGDYDITLLDSSILRVSRSYAKNFKAKFEQHNQLTMK